MSSSDRHTFSDEELGHMEKDLNFPSAKRGTGWGVPNAVKKDRDWSDSTMEAGVDKVTERDFPGSHVVYGGVATGRIIPVQEGGDQLPGLKGGRPTKDKDFEGRESPEEKQARRMREARE